MSDEDTIRAGAVKVDITPEDLTGLNPMGASRAHPMDPTFTGIDDRLHARVLALASGADELIFISIDCVEVGNTVSWRRSAAQRLGIHAEDIFVAATHSHNAPRLGRPSKGAMTLPPSTEALTNSDRVFTLIETAVIEARRCRQPVRISAASGGSDVAINRDHPRGQGMVDDRLRTVGVRRGDGTVMAVIANYGVHSTTMLGTGFVSADLAGAAANFIEGAAPGSVALWMSGALGNQVARYGFADFPAVDDDQRAVLRAVTRAQGAMIGAEAIRLMNSDATDFTQGRLSSWESVRTIPVRTNGVFTRPQSDDDTVDLRLLLARIGDVNIVGVSGEVDAELAEEVRASLGECSDLIVTSLVNDRIGYLPGDDAWARSTFSVSGCPIEAGDVTTAVVGGIALLMHEAV